MMKKIIVFLAFILLTSFAFAQHKITLQLNFSVEEKSSSSYYFASNLNGWNPSESNFQFQKKSSGEYELTLQESKSDLIQFKITKGTWDAVESTVSGDDVSNRVIRKADIISDTTIAASSEWPPRSLKKWSSIDMSSRLMFLAITLTIAFSSGVEGCIIFLSLEKLSGVIS